MLCPCVSIRFKIFMSFPTVASLTNLESSMTSSALLTPMSQAHAQRTVTPASLPLELYLWLLWVIVGWGNIVPWFCIHTTTRKGRKMHLRTPLLFWFFQELLFWMAMWSKGNRVGNDAITRMEMRRAGCVWGKCSHQPKAQDHISIFQIQTPSSFSFLYFVLTFLANSTQRIDYSLYPGQLKHGFLGIILLMNKSIDDYWIVTQHWPHTGIT